MNYSDWWSVALRAPYPLRPQPHPASSPQQSPEEVESTP